MIWHKPYSHLDWADNDKMTIHSSLGIEVIKITNSSISGRIPIDKRTHQHTQILHGGASIVLAESLGSIGSQMIIDTDKYFAAGQSITANHIRPGIRGWATGIAEPIHIGKKSHIWNINIYNDDDDEQLICTCRLTMAIINKRL